MVFPIIRPVTEILWRKRARSLKKARKAFRAGDPEGLHDLRVALRRTAATAEALGKKKIVRGSRQIVRALSELRQLEVDRGLLARVRELGWLAEDGASGLDARWSALFAADAKKATRAADGRGRRRRGRDLKRRARAARCARGRARRRRRAVIRGRGHSAGEGPGRPPSGRPAIAGGGTVSDRRAPRALFPPRSGADGCDPPHQARSCLEI